MSEAWVAGVERGRGFLQLHDDRVEVGDGSRKVIQSIAVEGEMGEAAIEPRESRWVTESTRSGIRIGANSQLF